MKVQNEQLLELVTEVDEKGSGLTQEEIYFIADIIDGQQRHFTAAEAKRIRKIHDRRVGENDELDDD